MSSCFNGDGHARQLRWTVTMLAALACGAAHAQSVDDQPFTTTEVVSDRMTTGGTPLRIWHRTESYGLDASETAIGGRGAIDLGGAVGFTDGQFRVSNESRFGANVGGGVRWYGSDFLVGQPRIFGVSGWYDGQETVLDNYFNQGGVSFESLGEYIDFRLNANIPFEDSKAGDVSFVTGGLNFAGNSLSQTTIIPTDVALRVVDFEVAPRVFDLNLWMYGGGYQMDGDGVSEMGAKVGFRGYVTNDLAVDVGVTDDEVFHTNTMFQVIWTPGRTGAGPTSWIHTLADRMREPVYRNTYIATARVDAEGSMALTDAAGDELRIVHVDNDAAAGGDGTFERPLNSLELIDENSQQGDVILVHAGSMFSDQTATIENEQRFLGEGGGNTHTITTSQLGTITIPETFANATNAARPIIDNPDGDDSVVLTSSTADGAAFSPIEVSNFTFTDGRSAITTTTGVGAVNINRLSIDSTASDAIVLSPITETLSGGAQRVRFSPTIDDVTLTNISGDGILLDDVATLPVGATSTGTVAISDITSSNAGNVAGAGAGIRLVEGRRTVTINGFDWDGGTTGEGALSVEDAVAQGNVTVTGTNDWTGGAGYAINLDNSANAVTVGGTTITNTGGDTIVATGGTANLSFTGRINQANNASVLSVTGGHDGTMTFTELTANAGVISATNGDGLQFNNADGAYTFNDAVILNGGDAAIDVIGGSSGTFAFTDTANVISEQSGDAIVIQGSDAVFTYEGTITTDNTSGRPINISGNTGGSITIAAAINGTDDGILIENNSGGAVLFSDQVTLNTAANDAVTIQNNTGGSVQFNNIDITTTSGDGFVGLNGTGTATITVLAGSGNTITTAGGVGLSLDNVIVGGSGITFESINVAGGANGIVLNNVTGGLVDVTGTGSTDGSGGSLSTTGDAIVITNAARVSINNMNITTTGDSQGVEFNVTNSNQSRFELVNTNVDVNTTAVEGVLLNIGDDAVRADVRLVGNDVDNAGSGNGVTLATADNDTALRTVNLLLQNNTIATASADATDRAADLSADFGTVLNATVTNNTFNNTGAGSAFELESLNAATDVHLNLDANTAASTPANDYILLETAGEFEVEDVANVQTRNTGTVSVGPGITEEDGTITLPQAP